MGAFDDFTVAALADAEAAFGSQAFTLDGATYTGILNEFQGEEAAEIGGMLGSYNATLVCQKPQFSALTRPLQKTLLGKVLTIDGLQYVAHSVGVDGASVTFGLLYAR